MPPKKADGAAPAAPKSKSSHPTYQDMITDAIVALKDRNGSSRQKLKQYVKANNNLSVTPNMFDALFNKALKLGVEKGVFQQPKGPSGGTKLAKKAPAPKEKKPAAAKKAAAPKKDAAAKPAAKKAAPKKDAAAKPAAAPKKPAAKKAAAPAKKEAAKPAADKVKTGRVTKKPAAPKKAAEPKTKTAAKPKAPAKKAAAAKA